ncbi:hypothetical protein [Cellulomonas fimi]|uniref:Secreted protein n=1 Tax=Cellulomonas fimi TaxID=1708 RepID=A0A7Y0LYS9_CELFI|nr:hypothetical protein [Cellulomonas fimi]NMR20390.1 hypothetical protein [Cellulomonas fimi]
MKRLSKIRAAIVSATAALLVAGVVGGAPAQAAEWEPPPLDGRAVVTVSTLWGVERVVTGPELSAIIARPGLYTAYSLYFDRNETNWAANGAAGWLVFSVQDPPNELVTSFGKASATVGQMAQVAELWKGCVTTRTPLSAPDSTAKVTVYSGARCS